MKEQKANRGRNKSVLEVEHKSVVVVELYFNIALVLTPPASHNLKTVLEMAAQDSAVLAATEQ